MPARSFPTISRDLAAVGRRFASRGWVLGTGGNFSEVVARRPFRLAISPSSVDKGELRGAQIIRVDGDGQPVGRSRGIPSGETRIHLEVIRQTGAGAVLHTHSVFSTVLSDVHAAHGALDIEGYEMLKALHGVRTHEHHERIPILTNDQDMKGMARKVGIALAAEPRAHAVLLRRHGLYTWGATLPDAVRHVEALEFLFEAICRTRAH